MNLREKYKKQIIPELKKQFGLKNDIQVPKVTKVVINVGFGRMSKEKAYIDNVVKGLTMISGQKPVLNKAKKSISSFKVREGQIIGASVALRGQRMYEFLDKLINVSFPRIRDFRGISDKGIDRLGNMTVGFKEYLAFPEIRDEDLENVYGLEVCIATTAKDREKGLALFTLMGFPFKKNQ